MKRPLEPSAEGRGRIVGVTDGVFAIGALGAALCLITPLLGIGFILLVQLIYAAAPRGSLLRKLIG
ncbi:hypothetical protein EN873_12420 [bacterium M00.F.Ca.ET.230.01.1.1]|nr:hypothetical protein EN873_12420 [bacterium M00.F.Ca.ET.230.01.1.1]